MKRYAPRVIRGYWDDGADFAAGNPRSLTVVEPKVEPAPTGLFDHHGNELMRLPDEPRPIGFLHVYEDEDG
jgi:hypothetical protein